MAPPTATPKSPQSPRSTRQGDGPPAGSRPIGFPDLLVNAAWSLLLATGLAAIVLGLIVLAWPGVTLVVVGALFGAYLLVSGVFQLAGTFAHQTPDSMRALAFISGALSVLLGLLCFRGPAQSILLLALWIGFGWLMRGITQTATAFAAPDLPGRNWHVAAGIISALAGIVLITAPFSSIGALTLVSGIWLVVLGAVEISHAYDLRRRARLSV